MTLVVLAASPVARRFKGLPELSAMGAVLVHRRFENSIGAQETPE